MCELVKAYLIFVIHNAHIFIVVVFYCLFRPNIRFHHRRRSSSTWGGGILPQNRLYV